MKLASYADIQQIEVFVPPRLEWKLLIVQFAAFVVLLINTVRRFTLCSLDTRIQKKESQLGDSHNLF